MEFLKEIADCRDNKKCLEFCSRYSLTEIPEILVGKTHYLKKMSDFFDENQVSNNGMFEKSEVEEDVTAFKMGIGEGPNKDKLDFFDEEDGEGNDMENVQWDFYKKSFDLHKSRTIKRKMANIKNKVLKEFDELNLHQNFITVKNPKIDLDAY